jgi:hypothetical protein
MLAEWTDVKSVLTNRSLSAQYTVIGSNYWIKAIDGAFELECVIPTDTSLSSDSLDFVTNFQSNSNKSIVTNTSIQNQPPYGSKTVVINGVTKKLYARNTGVQFSVVTGSNTLSYTATYAWAKLIGVEAVNCEALDTVDFKVYDTSTGTYSGTPNMLLQQFSYSLNLPKDFYQRMSEFDADVYSGMVIQLTYVSQSNKNIGVNFLFDEVK